MTSRASIIVVLCIGLTGCDGDGTPGTALASESILDALGQGVDPAFARVTGPTDLEFPRDHGPHGGHQIEWWYFTGSLVDDAGLPWGFQLTFFRTGLVAGAAPRSSPWAARHTWMAHLAVTDGAGRRFGSREHFAREALGLAGARSAPFRVWTGRWSASSTAPEETDPFPLRLQADGDGVAIDLVLEADKPMVLQGDRGYSRKGADPGNASQYVSFTRLTAAGSVGLGERRVSVTGTAWMDHEWSTSALDDGLVGWDWFSIQLDDGRDVMVYALRREDGSPGPFSAAVVIDAEGGKASVPRDGFSIEVVERWTSPHTGVRYPSRWRIRIPGHGVDLEVRPIVADQELRLAVVYWEGAVTAHGADGRQVGRGYVELVGYAERRPR